MGYTYNISNSTGGPLSTVALSETQTFYDHVDSQLESTTPFTQTEITVYRGPSQNLNNLDLAYSVHFNGDVKDAVLQTVEESVASAWLKTDPSK